MKLFYAFVIIMQYNHDYKGVNMRKKLNIAICLMIAICILIFAVACQPKDENGFIKLSKPKNLSLNGGTLSWDEVKNAQLYYIAVDGKELEKTANTTTFDIGSAVEGYGNFSVAVRAYGDGVKYGTSDYSDTITYNKGKSLNTPQVEITDGIARWNAVEFAVNYKIRVTDGDNNLKDELTSEELSYDFKSKKSSDTTSGEEQEGLYSKYGAYRISVIACPSDDNSEYSQSLAGFATYYNSTKLATPKFAYMTGTTIRWDSVANATNYTIRKTCVDDGTFEEATTTGTSYSYLTRFNLEKVGKYYFTVRANGDELVYYTSDWTAQDEEYSLNKIAPLNASDIKLQYDAQSAKLSWKISADSPATQITLDFTAMLPDGSSVLEKSVLQKTISNTVKFVSGDVYDYYEYGSDDKAVKGEGKIVVYNMAGLVKVRYDGNDYFLKSKSGEDVNWKEFRNGSSVDIVCDKADAGEIKFINDAQQVNDPNTGDLLVQKTDQTEDVLGLNGKQLYYFDKVDGESDIDVKRELVYDGDDVTFHTFELCLDDVFFKESSEGGYDYLLSDQYYGLLYNVSLSADNTSKNFAASEAASAVGQYMSYKIPSKNNDGAYVINNAGEYAYIIFNSYLNENNTDKFSIEKNINFNGYEIAQIDSFRGAINGNFHTVSNIVVGNKVLTVDGVVEREDKENLKYSMFVSIDGDETNGIIQNVFYLGMSYVGYDKEKLDEATKSIAVAPIAIDNNGTIRNVVVQSDKLSAEGADVAGMVINNNKYINNSTVYAELSGRNAGGVAVNNSSDAFIMAVGFYGSVKSDIGEILTDGVTSIGGAGFAVNNRGNILNSFAVGSVAVTATGELDNIYAGGFVGENSGVITTSYSGEFTLNNIFTEVSADGDNGFAGGFVGRNLNGGSVTSSYSTNRVTASLYSGGFVGFNDGSISGSYSTGRIERTGTHRGAFVGSNTADGTIENSICYTTDVSAKDELVDVLTSSAQLNGIADVVNADGDKIFFNAEGYRIPLISNVIYTKSNDTAKSNFIFEMRPAGTIVEISGTCLNNAGESQNAEPMLFGDTSKKGNRVVAQFTVGSIVRFVYGRII